MAAMMQQEKEKPGLLARYVPILQWLPHYNKTWLTGDMVAGLSVWALMVPQCLGFAAICGVPIHLLNACDISNRILNRAIHLQHSWNFEGLKKLVTSSFPGLIAAAGVSAMYFNLLST
jgi:hypothetical protein